MKNLLEHWGTEASVSVKELLAKPTYWRQLMYDRKLLVLRNLPPMSMDQLWDLHQVFGKPWTAAEYAASLEGVKQQTEGKCVTVYGNVTSAKSIGDQPMPWHRDIPWHRDRRYPIRSLYPVRLENGVATNTTRFCDADQIWRRFPKDQWQTVSRARIKIQNWYQMISGLEPQTRLIPLVEQHSQTERWSLLLNSFGYNRPDLEHSTARTGTWILDCVDPADQSMGLEFIERLHRLVCTDDNVYEHEWRKGDLVLFDNMSGVFHNRGRLVPGDPTKPMHREFWRMNLKHPNQA